MLEPIFPIAIYLILGYTFKIIYHDNSKQLIEFIIYFSLPAIVFSKIYPLVLDEKILNLILMFISFILFNLLLAYFIGKMMKLNRVLLATFMIMATFGNTSFIGFSYINAFYGEDKTPDYAIVNANFGYKFTFEKSKMMLNTGIENIFDANYTTYTDWKNLPRMGRNIFVNLMFQF